MDKEILKKVKQITEQIYELEGKVDGVINTIEEINMMIRHSKGE